MILERLDSNTQLWNSTLPKRVEWDGQFLPYELGLGRPYDLLKEAKSDLEQRLLCEAQMVYERLQQFDTLHQKALSSSDENERNIAFSLQRYIAYKAEMLLAGVDGEKLSIQDHESILDEINDKYRTADAYVRKETDGEIDMIEIIRQRISHFDGIQIATDLDKTLSTHANYLQMIPGSVQAENYMAHPDHGRNSFPLVFARYWQEAMKVLASNFYTIGKHIIPMRSGVEDFFKITEQAGIPVDIMSANFRPLVNGFISRLQTSNIRNTYAIEVNNILATDKSTLIQKTAIANPTLALFYFGDGDSDLPAMDEKARRVVACYFALEGGTFATNLKEAHLPYVTFRSFHDINNVLLKLHLTPAQSAI